MAQHLEITLSNRDHAPGDLRRALAQRGGAIVPLLCDAAFDRWLVLERLACIDTTAAGGDVALLGG